MDSLFLNSSYCVMFLFPILGLLFCSISEKNFFCYLKIYSTFIFILFIHFYFFWGCLINGGGWKKVFFLFRRVLIDGIGR